MSFNSVIRTLETSPLTQDLLKKLDSSKALQLQGISRLPKGLISTTIAQCQENNLVVVCATLEEAARWAAQLEVMGWKQVFFYPTSEAFLYESFDSESEMVWGQMQVLSTINSVQENESGRSENIAIVTTEKALQPHLPPSEVFNQYCLDLTKGMTLESKTLERKLTVMGYERVSLVEVEGQWSRRGGLIDIFPVSAELPVRLELFGDELEQIKEFDAVSQRSLDSIQNLTLTPTNWNSIIIENIADISVIKPYLSAQEYESLEDGNYPEGMVRFLGIAFDSEFNQNKKQSSVASILDYLPVNTIIAIDEFEQCKSHNKVWLEEAEEKWQLLSEIKPKDVSDLPKLHRKFEDSLSLNHSPILYLSEIVEENNQTSNPCFNLASKTIPVTPNQFGKIAEILRGKKEVFQTIKLNEYSTWLMSNQPSRCVSLLQEHDCPAKFIPNPKDYLAIKNLQKDHVPVALKSSGKFELEGFILPTFRIAIFTDREFFGQHSLATPIYIRKKRKAASKKINLDKLKPGDYVVHKHNGIGKFLKLESLANREYLVIQYADGLLRVPADNFELLSRYRYTGKTAPKLHKMSGKDWEKVKNKVRKSIKKLAVNLLDLYAKRSQLIGYSYPSDSPWQKELEESFPYQPTPDQLKATEDVKNDLESDRPMDRLICGDVGFGKTEVAIRSIFKVITGGNKQVAFLAPTTILTQQHYHTLKERFAPYPINIGLLNRFRTASERKEILQRLATGELDVVVGTQQLLNKSVKFRDLGLLVVDEEQRFGVNQKEKIKAMKTSVDVLTLSATPIPRTLYMSLSGVREMSLITTPPPSRRPIKTHLSPYNPEVVRTAIRNELDRGGQIFYVLPRIEGIEEVAFQLRKMIPSLRIAIAHGQMPEGELEATMLAFNNGEAELLLCTTIIESGLDIPRVNTIIVEDSQRFGLAQLYQLRGRVGRAGIQAHAWLLYPNQETLTDTARKRLRALQEFSQLGSGYHLAIRDMEIRGVGSLLGAQQSGQVEAIGFDLYSSMLQEAINEIQGQEIPTVQDTQIDLSLTAFIPKNYISDLEQKMDAYRRIATANSLRQLAQIEAEWNDRYGKIPQPAQQLLQVGQLKQIAKSLGFSRVKPEGKQHIVLQTPMQEPAWKLLQEKLPAHLQPRFVYGAKKVIVKGLGTLKPQQQLDNLITWLSYMRD